jgi:hypothetical protein
MRTLVAALVAPIAALSCAAPIDPETPPPPRLLSSELLVDRGARALDVGDVDGDGRPDLLVVFGDPSSPVEDHGLSLRRSRMAMDRRRILVGVASARLGDVDGDGVADVVVADGQGLGVLRGSADGPRPMDLRRAGRERELLAVRTSTDGAEALVSDTRGRVSIAPMGRPQAPATEIDVAPLRVRLVADADGDGVADLLLDLPSGELGLRRGRGATFEPAAWLLGPRHADAIAVAPGLVTAASGRHLMVLVAEGRGFRRRASVELARAPKALALADVDADGRIDLLSASAHALDVLCDVAAGARPCLSERGPWEKPLDLRVADLDGDGRPELLVADPDAGAHVVRIGP